MASARPREIAEPASAIVALADRAQRRSRAWPTCPGASTARPRRRAANWVVTVGGEQFLLASDAAAGNLARTRSRSASAGPPMAVVVAVAAGRAALVGHDRRASRWSCRFGPVAGGCRLSLARRRRDVAQVMTPRVAELDALMPEKQDGGHVEGAPLPDAGAGRRDRGRGRPEGARRRRRSPSSRR